MWMLTEGSVHKLQDCRDGSSPIGSGTARALCVEPHLHCSFSHVEEVAVVCVCVLSWVIIWKCILEPVCAHCTPYAIRLLAGNGFLWIRSVLKRFHPGVFRTAELEFKLSCPFSCRYWKPHILDLWNLQKGLISAAGTGFPFLLGINCTTMKWRYAMESRMLLTFERSCFVLEDSIARCIRGLTWSERGLRGAGESRCCPWTAARTGPQLSPWKTASSTQGSLNQIKKQWYTKGESNANSHHQDPHSSLFCF